jgi:hypothetical protein
MDTPPTHEPCVKHWAIRCFTEPTNTSIIAWSRTIGVERFVLFLDRRSRQASSHCPIITPKPCGETSEFAKGILFDLL